MEQNIYLTNMFPDYVPPEELMMALSQAAIVAADIDPAKKAVEVAIHSEAYIPGRLLEQAQRAIASCYKLNRLEIKATHPADQLQKIEPEDLMGPTVFLASDAANFVNGHILYVDGGILAYIGKQP